MGTRSRIGIKEKGSDTIKSVYCHWDGYIDGNGIILFSNYNTPDKARELIEAGGMSSLGATIDECNFYEDGEARNIPVDEYYDVEEFNYYFDMSDNEWYVGSDWHLKPQTFLKLDDVLHVKEYQDMALEMYTEESREEIREVMNNATRDNLNANKQNDEVEEELC